jgi:hypothetical protein
MKKHLVPIAVILLLALAAPSAFAELELGMSWTPVTYTTYEAAAVTQSVPGFHVGYGWFILYASWDSLAMPSWFVQAYTGNPDLYTPGFLNLYDVGVRFVIKPVLLYATVGTNSMNPYNYAGDISYGANIRLGAGLKFGWWGINISGTNVYGSWDDLTAVVKALGAEETRPWAYDQIVNGLVPSLNLTFYF